MHPQAGAAETITAPSVLKNIDKSTKIRAKNKTNGFLMNCIKNPFRFGAGGGTRTHTVLLPTDFESVTSANSITPAIVLSLYHT